MADKQVIEFAEMIQATRDKARPYHVWIEVMGQALAFFESIDMFVRKAEEIIHSIPLEYDVDFKFEYTDLEKQ